MKKLLLSIALSLGIYHSYEFINIKPAFSYDITSFNEIRGIEITEDERKADIINFDEFLRIHFYNYISQKTEKEKNTLLVKLNSDISKLKYSKTFYDKKPPIILHWTAGNNAMGAIKTLFMERRGMKEGLIGVDYVVSEPLLHPDYPNRPARSYSIKLSKSEVATTWFRVPEKSSPEIKAQDRKYNKSISIEIVGWRYTKNEKGKKDDFSENGKKGIREDFNGNYDEFDNFEEKYVIYPTVLKLVNNLAEKHNFTDLIDDFTPEQEIDPNLKEKGIIYLNGPLSKYIKGHGLVALEHTLMFGGTYVKEKHDFTPKELLLFYADLKDFRSYQNDMELVKGLEELVSTTEKLSTSDYKKISELILNIKSKRKKEYLTAALDLNNIKVTSIDKLNQQRKEIDFFPSHEKEKLTQLLITKFIDDADKIQDDEYKYLKNVIVAFKDYKVREKISQQLYERYAYNNKKRNS